MNRNLGLILGIAASLLAGALPMAVSWQLSVQQTRQLEEERLLRYARDVMHRSERASGQVFSGIDKLIAARGDAGADPCSPRLVAMMGQIDLMANDIQAMGYIANGRLMCSSYGHHGEGLLLEQDAPMASIVSDSLRAKAKLPFAPGMTFIIVERDGFAAIIHEAITIDIATTPENVSLGTFSPRTQVFRSSRGTLKAEWSQHAHTGGEVVFDDGEYLIAIASSKRYNTQTMAAQPLSNLKTPLGGSAVQWFGLLAGAALAALTFMVARRQMGMTALLRRALRRDELFLLYQPIVDLQTRRCIGAEALIRWRRSDGTLVPPDRFIPVAESAGMIQEITARVLQIVAAEAQDIFRAHPQFHIGINLAAADLQSQHTVDLLATLLHATGAGARNILVEATERGLMDATQVRQVIHNIHALGIEVAIDDFGTGYSSLSYLGTFDLDYLKIDKSFVDTLQTDAATSQVALHIIEMAKALKLRMIAEGVETESQAALLQARGVQLAQGWLFAKPMRMVELRQFIATPPTATAALAAPAGAAGSS